MAKAGRRPKSPCDGSDPMLCFRCPYHEDDCHIRDDFAVRGGVTKDIEEALAALREPRDVETPDDSHEKYLEHRAERLAYFKRKTDENRVAYAREQACIKKARIARKWSQPDLGRQLGVTQSTVSRWELGKSPAPWDELKKIMPELEEMRT